MQAATAVSRPNRTSEKPELTKQSLSELQEAFSAFTSMSEQLSDSYHVLEKRVVELSGELASLSEQRLKELNEKELIAEQLESLLSIMPAAVIVLDNKGIIKQANPTAQKWLASAVGEGALQLINKPWSPIIRLAFAPKSTDYHEVSLRDGRLVSLETSALDNSGQLIMMTDQTETRELQTQVARQERLTAMGQMVASLAHQIRTPLSAALLYAANLKNPKLSTEVHDQFADKLVGRLHHLEKQVQDMLLYVKGEAQLNNTISVTGLTELLQEAVAGLPSEQKNQIDWRLAESNALVQCQSDALVSAFMNVINNALEASKNKMTVVIKPQKKNVIFSFIDTGPGMTLEKINRVKEPFYTTKSYGTGLGIPVVIATVKAHKGELNIVSQPGAGTEFRISLPVLQER